MSVPMFTLHSGQIGTSSPLTTTGTLSRFTLHSGQIGTVQLSGVIPVVVQVHTPHRSDGDTCSLVSPNHADVRSHSTQVRWGRGRIFSAALMSRLFTLHTGQMGTQKISTAPLGNMEVHTPHRSDGDSYRPECHQVAPSVHTPHRSDGDRAGEAR